MKVPAPDCYKCKHRNKSKHMRLRCNAFPEKIPSDIINNTFKHNKKHPEQDNDILYEPD